MICNEICQGCWIACLCHIGSVEGRDWNQRSVSQSTQCWNNRECIKVKRGVLLTCFIARHKDGEIGPAGKLFQDKLSLTRLIDVEQCLPKVCESERGQRADEPLDERQVLL